MKKIKNIVMLSLLAVVFATSSCSDFLNVNTDPNRVTGDNITPDLIFTNAQTSVGAQQATRFIYLNNWMGYMSRSGTFIVEQEETTYKVANTFPETNWDQAYNTLFDLYQVQTRALAANDSVLAGASMVLSVKLWQETVDQFGAIPYAQAFDYVNYPRPAYTPAADIYADLLVKMDKAISYLDAAAPKSSFVKTDLIFCRGGAINAANKGMEIPDAIVLWKKFANTIKLRMFLRQSEKGFVPSSTQIAKIVADGGFLAAGEDVAVQPGYSNQTAKQNPFYAQFGLTPSGAPATTNNKPNNYFKALLSTTDPRLERFYASSNGLPTGITGTDYGAVGGNKASVGGLPVFTGTEIGPGLAGSATQDQFILPSFESLFFQAEAAQRGWIAGTAQTLFESAITQSFVWLGVATAPAAATTYITTVPSAMWANSGTTSAAKIQFIAFQKYVALCGIDAVESWSDLRRGVLVLPAASGYSYLSNNVNKDSRGLPRVMPYPQTELTTNSASLPARTADNIFTEKLFWQP